MWEASMLKEASGYAMGNMKIWENLEGHCIADIAPRRWPGGSDRRRENVRNWRKQITHKGYRDGWRYRHNEPFENLDQMNDNGVLIGPYQQLVPKGAPPREARLKLKEARRKMAEWDHTNQSATDTRRAASKEYKLVRKAFNCVIQKIGKWEMPGGDLMIMLLKKKIPIEIVRTLLDYGMYTFNAACFNDHARARQVAATVAARGEAEIDEIANEIASFYIVNKRNLEDNDEYDDYFAPGWRIGQHPQTASMHFIIKQYAQEYVNRELDSQWLFSPIKNLKYF